MAKSYDRSKADLVAEYDRLGYVVVWRQGHDPFVYKPGIDPKTATRRVRIQDRTVRREARNQPGEGWFSLTRPIAHRITLAALRNL